MITQFRNIAGKFKPYADEALRKGIKVIFLNIGHPDVPTPQPIIDAFHAFRDPVLAYGPAQGFLELRQAGAGYFGGYNISLTADNSVVTMGGSEAILFSFAAVSDPGGEIIIPEPFYTNYNGYASLASIKIVPLTLSVENGYRLPPRGDIEAKITPRTKAILLCSPNNPTGTVYTEEEPRRVAEIVKERNLFFIGDEVYKEFIYDGAVHKSILEFSDIQDRTIGLERQLRRGLGRDHLSVRVVEQFDGIDLPLLDLDRRRRGVLRPGLGDRPRQRERRQHDGDSPER